MGNVGSDVFGALLGTKSQDILTSSALSFTVDYTILWFNTKYYFCILHSTDTHYSLVK